MASGPRQNRERTLPGTAELDQCLARAATSFGPEPDLGDMLRVLREAVEPLGTVPVVGIGIYAARREVLVVRLLSGADHDADGGVYAREGEEFRFASSRVADLMARPEGRVSDELTGPSNLPVERSLFDAGARRYLAIPLVARRELAGVFYAGFSRPEVPADHAVRHCQRLARVLSPVFEAYRARERFARGDRRRATLIELSEAINQSLRLDEVLASAHDAICRIDGHRVSIIGILHEDGRTFRAYQRPRPDRESAEPAPPRTLPVEDTALSWVLSRRVTYESDDLIERPAFALDESLREAGVRRYTCAPMFVRGRIIGGLFFGTHDPHPALTTDVWLYENIALQLALAIDNANQFEALRRLSDRLAQQNVYLQEEIATEHNVEGMVGRSAAIRRVFEQINRVAGTDATVLILGETGVGKELVARAIHARSARADHPLVKVNCAAIPENLVESELFGHERGAFTSASTRRIGRFELAHEGTLFLDEIGELPLAVQAKLLRVLQDGDFERVGGTQTIRTDVRIIAATNRDLARGVESGTFRSDLYYRIHAFPIAVPPLADRRDDIPLLVAAFIAQLNRRMGRNIRAIEADSLEYLRQRDWPGNIRELRHEVERAMILGDGPELVVDRTNALAAGFPVRPAVVASRLAGSPREAPTGGDTLKDVERAHIVRVLEATHWIVEGPRGAATRLGLNPSTLRSRMKRLGIRRS